jgi:hypothetical protein
MTPATDTTRHGLPPGDAQQAMVASRNGNHGHSCEVCDLRIANDGFERMAVFCPPGTQPAPARHAPAG